MTEVEFIQLRLKCLEPLIMTASKVSLEKSEILPIAEKHWQFAIAGTKTPDAQSTDTLKETSEPKKLGRPPLTRR